MQTKIKPAPLKYPNGGGLKAAAQKAPASQGLEMEALEAKHKVEIAKLKEKHASANKVKANPSKVKAKKNG